MNILFLTQIIPYPPDAGPKVKTWHVLRYLVEHGHRVILASFVRPEEEAHVPVLEELCDQVHAVPMRRSRPADLFYWLRSQLTGRPFIIERDDLPAMHKVIKEILSTECIDIIHADQLNMAQFPLKIKQESQANGQNDRYGSNSRPSLVFDAHNAVWTIVERMSTNVPWFLKPFIKLEARRIKSYEALILQAYHHTLAVTKIDRKILLETAGLASKPTRPSPPEITVIPITVDTEKLQPVERRPGSSIILTIGTLHYPPNEDGIRWFIHEVYPLIRQEEPGATLTIIGKNPPKDFLRIASQKPDSIAVTGYVPDLTPYLQQTALMVVPVRAGSGMRVRILDAFARGLPMVTTTIGLEGIDAVPGEDILVADSAVDFAEAVIMLLQDPSTQTQLAQNGRRLAETRYDWESVLQKMDATYDEVRSTSQPK